jgi:hypothetical protein
MDGSTDGNKDDSMEGNKDGSMDGSIVGVFIHRIIESCSRYGLGFDSLVCHHVGVGVFTYRTIESGVRFPGMSVIQQVWLVVWMNEAAVIQRG